jgi:hypothetical protein
MANPMASNTWRFMTYSGELSSVYHSGGTQERNPPHGGPLPFFFLLPRNSRHQITVLSLQDACDRINVALLRIGGGL